jgi:hypothetical protein
MSINKSFESVISTKLSNNMNRRTVIQNLSLGMGTLLTLPSWANNWNVKQLPPTTLLNSSEEALLSDIIDTIIPKTNTLGAKEIGVGKFVERMITDCTEKIEQDNFKAGLQRTSEITQQKFGKNFTSCSQSERLQVLNELQKNEDVKLKNYFGLVKRLTIQGYMGSEYVMTNITKYEFAPGRYHGCVEVKK